MIVFRFSLNLQSELRGSQEKMDHPHLEEGRYTWFLVYMSVDEGELGEESSVWMGEECIGR